VFLPKSPSDRASDGPFYVIVRQKKDSAANGSALLWFDVRNGTVASTMPLQSVPG